MLSTAGSPPYGFRMFNVAERNAKSGSSGRTFSNPAYNETFSVHTCPPSRTHTDSVSDGPLLQTLKILTDLRVGAQKRNSAQGPRVQLPFVAPEGLYGVHELSPKPGVKEGNVSTWSR